MPSGIDANANLAQSSPPQEALNLLLETALDAVIVMRSDGAVADWNDHAVRVFGWTREEEVGRTMAERKVGAHAVSSSAAPFGASAAMSGSGLVSRVTPVHTALRNCTRDEGRSFEFGNQVLISSHRKLLRSKAMVVSVAEK